MGKKKTTEIWASACHHLGSKSVALSLLEKHIAMAVKNRWNTVLLGDLIDCGVSSGSKHVGLEFQQAYDPMGQVEKVIELFSPLAEAGLIKGIWGGNHAYRAVKAVGISPEKFIAMALSLVADPSKKPTAVLPSLIQRVYEVYELSQGAAGGGRGPMEANMAKMKLMDELAKMQVRAGTEADWVVPFFPGLGFINIDGIPILANHGMHVKSKDNWARLDRADKGFRLMLTAHNHEMQFHPDYDIYQGKRKPVDFVSVGTYQTYAEYASIAAYPPRPPGSALITFDHDANDAQCVFLKENNSK